MNRNAYLIVKEFVNSASEQARKNAVTALTVLTDPDALKDLVSMILTDPAPAVRECAEHQIAKMPATRLALVVEMLHERIAAQAEDQYAAYALLGRLRSQGIPIGKFRVPLQSRILLAKRTPEAVPFTRRSAALRNLAASFCGGSIGLAVFFLLLRFVFDISIARSDLVFYSCLSLGMGILAAVAALSLGVPIGAQADPVATVFIDFGMVLLVSFVASFGASLRLIGTDRSNTALLCVFVMLPAAMVAIRLAMLLVMGTFENRAVNLWCGIGCGTAAGLVALSAVPMILKQTGTGVVAAVWMAAVPVTAAVATAFAVMDRQSRALPLVPGPWRALGFVPLIFLLAAIGWHSWAGTLGNSTGYPQLSDKKAPRTVNFTDVPGSLIFWTSKHETVRISKNCRSEYYTLTVRTPDLREQRNVPPGTETYDLAEGSYYVWLDADGVPGDVKGMEALPLVARRWYRNRPSTSAPTGEALCKVDFTFTPLE